MNGNFSFDVSWLPQSSGPAPVSSTAANLTIRIGSQIATRNDDDWSKSVENSARLALYPLALWLAGSWWRLRWEAEPPSSLPGSDWRMSHELGAVGHGFLWPNLKFASDSQSIQVVGRPTNPLSEEPVRFLADFEETIPADAFERAIDDFIGLVLARLRAVGVENSDLEQLWHEVLRERREPKTAMIRRFEAVLGFDPEDAPGHLLDRMLALLSQAGERAAEEIAPACAGPDPAGALNAIERIASLPGIKGTERMADALRGKLSTTTVPTLRPWEQGRSLARAVRSSQGWNGQPLNDESVGSLLGMRATDLAPTRSGESHPILGLAVRESGGELRMHFRKRNRVGRRFEAARLLCDELIAPQGDRWLPATNSRTNRQKIQRAFAAEFLCPIQSLDDFLSGDYSQDRIEEAAEHFGISPLAVSSHLANNGRISPQHLLADAFTGELAK
jgi:hypothetical protein